MLKAQLRPEFFNRIDDIIIFRSLSREDIKKIVHLQFKQVEKLLQQHSLRIELSPEAENYLATNGYDPVFGARPLKRLIQKEVVNPLAMQLLHGDYQPGMIVQVILRENSLDFMAKSG